MNNKNFEDKFQFNHLDLSITHNNGRFGVVNKLGETVIPFNYSNLIDFEDNELLLACNQDDFWGFISWQNEIIIPFEYDYASIFLDNYNISKVSKNGKFGYINRKNQEIVPIEYDSISTIQFNKIGVCKNEHWGIVNLKNEKLIDFKYDFSLCIAENIFYVGKAVDEIIEPNDYECELLTFKKNKIVKFGIIDERENLLMDFESYTTTGYYGNNKVLAFDYIKFENYLFDVETKERIYAPVKFSDNDKIQYLKAELNK